MDITLALQTNALTFTASGKLLGISIGSLSQWEGEAIHFRLVATSWDQTTWRYLSIGTNHSAYETQAASSATQGPKKAIDKKAESLLYVSYYITRTTHEYVENFQILTGTDASGRMMVWYYNNDITKQVKGQHATQSATQESKFQPKSLILRTTLD